jgi:DNA-binding NarL/FixJ family response regulator
MKLLLIDDHALFRDGMLLVLQGLTTQLEIFESDSYESAKTITEEHADIDLVLLDLGLPGISNLDALKVIQQQLPDSLIVVLSGTEDCKMVEQVFRHGARGYIPKSSPAKIMLNALQLVISGGIYIPPQILQNNILGEPTESTKHKAVQEKLTPRQCDVLHQLAKGQSNKGIGSALDLTESTVRAHVAAILRAFDVCNRTQAVRYAAQKQWI